MFQAGANIILSEFIRKNENGERLMVCTSSTEIVMCVTPVEVREELVTMGQNIVNPPPPATIQISSAWASPLRKRVSVSGKIIQICFSLLAVLAKTDMISAFFSHVHLFLVNIHD